jgi:hypothetical protein
MKYIVEGNIDFFHELYNSLDKEENEIVTECCLITNEPLLDKYVKLECGHSFNYVPLYYDIYNHKKKFNSMENNSGHLSSNEIRCPYCRHKQKGVLPYYEELGLEKVCGVNIVAEIQKNNYYKICEFLTENPKFNPNLPETEINLGNCKFYKCYFIEDNLFNLI